MRTLHGHLNGTDAADKAFVAVVAEVRALLGLPVDWSDVLGQLDAIAN